MEMGISVFSGIKFEKLIELYKKYGVKRTFLGSEEENFDEKMELFSKNGIICETLHAPFSALQNGIGGINDMWRDTEGGEIILSRLKDAIDKCYKYGIPVAIVHVSAGRPMPEINEIGIKRYDCLMDYARERNVKIAFENLRYLENLEFVMNRYNDAGFCWDNGHEYCYTPGEHFVPSFGKRLIALHIHDNKGVYDSDDHVLPFDGNINMEEVAKYLSEVGYDGTVMLEVTKNAKLGGEKIYENLTDEEYIERAVNSAKKLIDMIEKSREEII